MQQAKSDLPKPLFALSAYAILSIAAALRFWDLGETPLWMDEAYTILVARLPLQDILFGNVDNHPPLSYSIQNIWMKFFPSLDYARVPSALSGLAIVAVLILAANDLWSRQAALWAGALSAFSTALIFYSQDARMYSFLVLGLSLATWGSIGVIKLPDNPRLRLAFYIVGALIAVYAHVTAIIYLFCLNIGLISSAWLCPAPRTTYIRFLAANIVIGLLTIPWLVQLTKSFGAFGGIGTPGFNFRTTAYFIRNSLGYPGLPGIADYTGLLVLACVIAIGLSIAIRLRRRTESVVLAIVLIAYPIIMLMLNLHISILAARTLLPLTIPAFLLSAIALSEIRPRLLSQGTGAFLLSLGLLASVNAHFEQRKHDNAQAALLYASQAGYSGAPIVTCILFDAAALHLTSERIGLEHDIILKKPNGFIRFTWSVFETLQDSLIVFYRRTADEIDSRAGGGILLHDLPEALTQTQRAIFYSAVCDNQLEIITQQIEAAGFTLREQKNFTKAERIVMEKGESKLFLYER